MNQVLYDRLCEVARGRGITRYSEVSPLVGLNMADPEDRVQMSALLDELSRHEHAQGHPMLSAVVIHVDDNMPGSGFFTLATELGLFRGGERLLFFIEELRRVHDFWGTR